MAEYDLTVKIILLGDFSVNKGTILRALSSLPKEPEVTCLASRHGVVEMLFLRDGKRVRVKIHDTAGQERFRSITSSFYRGAHGCLLLFDVTDKSTFEGLSEWQQELRNHTITDDVMVTLAGNNCHVAGNQRQVAKRAAQEFASYLGVPYEEVSVCVVTTLVRALEDIVDRIILHASRTPHLSNSIKPLSRKLDEKQQELEHTKTKCAC